VAAAAAGFLGLGGHGLNTLPPPAVVCRRLLDFFRDMGLFNTLWPFGGDAAEQNGGEPEAEAMLAGVVISLLVGFAIEHIG